MNKSDLLGKIKTLLNRMRDHETPHEVTSKEALGPLLKDAEDLLETVSVLKYLIEEESEQEGITISVSEEIEEKQQQEEEPMEEAPQAMVSENDQQATKGLAATEPAESNPQITINEVISTTEKSTKVADKLEKAAVSDLPAVIGVNERYLFINELFDGDGNAYQIAIEQLNGFDHIQEAMKYVRNELSDKFNWDQEQESTISFYSLIEKRYAG